MFTVVVTVKNDGKTVMYIVFTSHIMSYWKYMANGSMARMRQHIRRTLAPKTGASRVGRLINSGPYFYSVTVLSREDIRFATKEISRVSEFIDESGCGMSYVNSEYVAWRVFREGCELHARPVWYKPPGRTLGLNLEADDPAEVVVDYYERNMKKIISAYEDEQNRLEKCWRVWLIDTSPNV